MKVLLTGATGFIGSHVLRSLQRCDIEVVVAGRSRPQEVATFVEANLLISRILLL